MTARNTSTKRKTCSCCKKKFTPQRSTAKFCSDSCRKGTFSQKVKTSKPRPSKFDVRLKRLRFSAFLSRLVFQARRAGTLEVIPLPCSMQNEEELLNAWVEIHSLYKIKQLADGEFDEGLSTYVLSHIAPVVHKTHVGTIYPQNLIVAPRDLNASHGNKYFSAGHRINRRSLNPSLLVQDTETKAEVAERILSLLSPSFVVAFADKCNIQPAAKHKALEWFEANPQYKAHPLVIEALKGSPLDSLSGAKLSELRQRVQGKLPASYQMHHTNEIDVLLGETERVSKFNPVVSRAYSFLLQGDNLSKLREATYWFTGNDYNRHTGRRDQLHQDRYNVFRRAWFNVLHGAPLEPFAAALEALLALVGLKTTDALFAEPSNVVALPVVAPAPVRKLLMPWEAKQKTSRPSRSTFLDDLDAEIANSNCWEDEDDDWQHLDVYRLQAV